MIHYLRQQQQQDGNIDGLIAENKMDGWKQL